MRIYKKFKESNKVTLFNGDCRELLKRLPDESVDLVVTSPPYCMGKAYENPHDDLETFKKQHQDIFNDLYRVVKPGGSICWQIGYDALNGSGIQLVTISRPTAYGEYAPYRFVHSEEEFAAQVLAMRA